MRNTLTELTCDREDFDGTTCHTPPIHRSSPAAAGEAARMAGWVTGLLAGHQLDLCPKCKTVMPLPGFIQIGQS